MSRITWVACPQCTRKFYFHTDDFAAGEWKLRCPYCADEFPPTSDSHAPWEGTSKSREIEIACPHCARRFYRARDFSDSSVSLQCPFCAEEFAR